jgi:hypothetical protein
LEPFVLQMPWRVAVMPVVPLVRLSVSVAQRSPLVCIAARGALG